MQLAIVLSAAAYLAVLRADVEILDVDINFDLDNECQESGSHCAINAIQLKASKAIGAKVDGAKADDGIDLCKGIYSDSCLCVFDIDRTLTAVQGHTECPGSKLVEGVNDNAYGQGVFTMSALSNGGINQSHCSKCYLGLVSHGNAHFQLSDERKTILHSILKSKPQDDLILKMEDIPWSDEPYDSPYVVEHPDGQKQYGVEKVLRFFERRGLCISKSNTYFYDDRADNVAPFQGTGMNAHQISCKSRDGNIGHGIVGYCGATTDEIKQEKGISLCKVDCVWEDWLPWGPCSATCEQGTQTRTRSRWVEAQQGGNDCSGPSKEVKQCLMPACPTTTTAPITTTTAPITTTTAPIDTNAAESDAVADKAEVADATGGESTKDKACSFPGTVTHKNFWDPSCVGARGHASIGCNADGKHVECRFCGDEGQPVCPGSDR